MSDLNLTTLCALLVARFLGEIFELREDLVSLKEDRKKEAVKKVIAAMTIGTKFAQVQSWSFWALCFALEV
jgi:vesicle coat complex subunit